MRASTVTATVAAVLLMAGTAFAQSSSSGQSSSGGMSGPSTTMSPGTSSGTSNSSTTTHRYNEQQSQAPEGTSSTHRSKSKSMNQSPTDKGATSGSIGAGSRTNGE